MNTISTREEWLETAIRLFFKPHFARYAPDLIFPERVRVSIGFPSKGGISVKKRVSGQCWHSETTSDCFPHIFISPLESAFSITDKKGILAILCHELIHACGIKGHKVDFKKAANGLGLTGKMNSSEADGWLIELFKHYVNNEIGSFPSGNVILNPLSSAISGKPDKCRMIKCKCDKCGYTVRTTKQWIDRAIPECPVCKIEMTV